MRDERRSFLKALCLTPLAPASLAPAAQSPPAAAAAEPSKTAVPAGVEAVAEALADAVRREHGAHLDAADVEAVRKEIARSLEAAARLRSSLRLRNSDEPVTSFSARRRA